MIPKRYDFKPQLAEDTFNGVQMTIAINGNPVDLTTVSEIKIQFTKQNSTTVVKTRSIDNGITVVDAANGVFRIDAFTVFSEPYTYSYDLEITYDSGVVKTYLEGVMTVKKQITSAST